MKLPPVMCQTSRNTKLQQVSKTHQLQVEDRQRNLSKESSLSQHIDVTVNEIVAQHDSIEMKRAHNDSRTELLTSRNYHLIHQSGASHIQ